MSTRTSVYQGSMSSSVYPIEWLQKTIQAKRDEAFAEIPFHGLHKGQEFKAMCDAYDICLRLIERGK